LYSPGHNYNDERKHMKKVSVKIHRNILSLAVKLNVIRHTEAGKHLFYVCKMLDLAGLTLQTTLEDKDKFKECGKIATPVSASKLKSTLCTFNC
jgi:hypothetical protein